MIYPFGELDEIVLAFATTIHKSQGSEYPGGRHPRRHPALCHAPAQSALHRVDAQLVVLIGQKKAVGIAVRGIQGRRRWSKLKELLNMEEAVLPAAPPFDMRGKEVLQR